MIKTNIIENTIEEYNENEESKDSIEEPTITSTSRNDVSSNRLIASRRGPEKRVLNDESFGGLEKENTLEDEPDPQTENRLDTVQSPLLKVTKKTGGGP